MVSSASLMRRAFALISDILAETISRSSGVRMSCSPIRLAKSSSGVRGRFAKAVSWLVLRVGMSVGEA